MRPTWRAILAVMGGVGSACTEPEDSGTPDAGYGVVVSETLVGAVDAMLVDGGSAFLCSVSDGLRIYDVTEPTAPTFQNAYYATDPCHVLDVAGSRVFTGTDAAFRSFSPNNMMVRGEYQTPYAIYALDAASGENAAWLTGPDLAGALWLEEVAYREDADMDSRRKVMLEGVATPVAIASRPGGLLLLDAMGALHTLDENLQQVGVWSPEVAISDPSRLRMALGDTDHAYLSLGEGGVVIVDVHDLASPTTAGRWPEDGRETTGLVLLDDMLYVGLEGALAILSVADPVVPAPTGAEDVALSSAPTHIWVTGGFGFLVDAVGGIFTVVDLD